jgi:nucleotide-binding universal stress UspA family protein
VLDVEAGEDGAVIVASRQLGAVGRFFLGSTSERMIRRGRTPLLVVPDRGP